MFYSLTILDRKGPLGTVWCAAHLHHKLNKSQYISTNIPSTVERIMHPEVPIALRISSHLLLGVVRIYSKQVEYLCQDCNILLTGIQKAFASTDVSLPETATLGTIDSVTLQYKFQLDAFDLNTDLSERFQDYHTKDPKEITLEGDDDRCAFSDQILVEQDPFIVVSFDEDVRNSPCARDPQPMEEDNCLYTPGGAIIAAQYPGPSNQERDELPTANHGSQRYPEMEIMRDAPSLQYFSENDPFWSHQSEDRLEPDLVLMELMKQKETTLAVELFPGVSPLTLEQHQEPVSVVSEQGPQMFDSDNPYGYVSPVLAIRSTPPAQQPMPNLTRRPYYDDETVLSSRLIKQQINDPSCILRTRKERPTDALGNWKLNKRIRKHTIFVEPLLTGLCSDLCDAYHNDFISAKPHLNIVNEACPQVPEISPTQWTPSPTRRHGFTPAFDSDTSSLLDLRENTCGGISDLVASTGTPGSNKVTPTIFLNDQPGVEDTFCTDIPELRNSGDGELSFLAEDDNNSFGIQETPECFLRKHSGKSKTEPLSARTRAVAQFLKNRSAITPAVQSQHVDISLKTILEGKTRKLCARMVFETLVLTNSGLVDVLQEKSYGDVTLTVTRKLSHIIRNSE